MEPLSSSQGAPTIAVAPEIAMERPKSARHVAQWTLQIELMASRVSQATVLDISHIERGHC